MAVEERIERLYLNVWKVAVLCIGAVALIVAVVTALIAVGGLFGTAPERPLWSSAAMRIEGLRKELALDNFRGASQPGAARSHARGDDPERTREEILRGIVDHLRSYSRTAYPDRIPYTADVLRLTVRNYMSDRRLQPEENRELYLGTLATLSEELANAGSAQAQLPEDRRMDPLNVLRWHAEMVERALSAVDQENQQLDQRYQRQLKDFANRHTRVLSYAAVSAVAFAVFVLTVFLFVIVRMQRDLQTMALASMLTVRQMDAAGSTGE